MQGKIGRPRLVSSPEEFDRLVDLYVATCQDPDKPKAITLTGLVLALGFCSKDTLYEYEKYEEFTDSVKRARLLVEQEYENRLVVGTNAAAPIFALKNFGWTDKSQVDVGGQSDNPLVTEIVLKVVNANN